MKNAELFLEMAKILAKRSCKNNSTFDYFEKDDEECGICVSCNARKFLRFQKDKNELIEVVQTWPNGFYAKEICMNCCGYKCNPECRIVDAKFVPICDRCINEEVNS